MIFSKDAITQLGKYSSDNYKLNEIINFILTLNDISDLRDNTGVIGAEEVIPEKCRVRNWNKGIFRICRNFIISVDRDTITGIGYLYCKFRSNGDISYSSEMNIILGKGYENSVLWDATTMKELVILKN